MKTNHEILIANAQDLSSISDDSIDLVVTSPPYPMVEMWNELFTHLNPKIEKALEDKNGSLAFELMHKELDTVWIEISRVVKKGGIVCINIGDATQKIGKHFCLYPSHSRIIQTYLDLGFHLLPSILWRKPTNSPTKFMGSGMLPPSAYVTLEHEHILIFRKGSRRLFISEKEKKKRYNSAYFWEERNRWFSDLWLFTGTNQLLEGKTRERSGAYPFELPYRLINMFSIENDVVLDPFLGTGTTILAAITSTRNSIGVEIDKHFLDVIEERLEDFVGLANKIIRERLEKHQEFIRKWKKDHKLKYRNEYYDFDVVTKQEKNILIREIESIEKISKKSIKVSYKNV